MGSYLPKITNVLMGWVGQICCLLLPLPSSVSPLVLGDGMKNAAQSVLREETPNPGALGVGAPGGPGEKGCPHPGQRLLADQTFCRTSPFCL